MQAEMLLVPEHRHTVERIVLQQPAVEPVPVFRKVNLRMAFRLGLHDAPDLRILYQPGHAVKDSRFACLMYEPDDCLRGTLQCGGYMAPLLIFPDGIG